MFHTVPSLSLTKATAAELQTLLQNGDLTSEQLIGLYLRQIHEHEPRLHALISVAPSHIVLERACLLDEERASGKCRGPLHGIPINLKDVILTSRSLGMPTTAGSHALAQTSASVNADVVDRLLAAGLIILAKANLSETWGPKGLPYMLPGWSAVGGQTSSAYVKDGLDPDDVILGNSSPLGSSTGCAVAVSAGYAPLAIGEETSGSLIAPANRAGLYALKITPGTVDMTGVFPISKTFDTLGPMAKGPKDIEDLSNIIAPGLLHRASGIPNRVRAGFVLAKDWWPLECLCRNDEHSNERMVSTCMKSSPRCSTDDLIRKENMFKQSNYSKKLRAS